MSAIFRKQVTVGFSFMAPANVSFSFQDERKAFSVCFVSTDAMDTLYVILGTGHEYDGIKSIAASVCIDGFHMFHLCRL